MLSCCSLHLLQQILDEVLLLRTEIPVDKLLLQIGLLLPDVSKIGRCSSVIATSIRIIVVEVNALLRVLGSPLRGCILRICCCSCLTLLSTLCRDRRCLLRLLLPDDV